MKLFEHGWLRRKGESWDDYNTRMRILTVLLIFLALVVGFYAGFRFGIEQGPR